MVMFNSYVNLPEGIQMEPDGHFLNDQIFRMFASRAPHRPEMFSDGFRTWSKDLKDDGYSFEFLIANSLLRAWFSLPTILVFVYTFSHKVLQLLDSLVLQCHSPRYFERRFDVVVAGTWAASHGTTGSKYGWCSAIFWRLSHGFTISLSGMC